MNILITLFYRRIFFLLLIIISSTVIFSNTNAYGETDYEIPEWVKINANWWMDDQLTDDEFVLSIKFLINEKIIVIPQNSIIQNSDLPDWIVHNAGWWHARIFTNSDNQILIHHTLMKKFYYILEGYGKMFLKMLIPLQIMINMDFVQTFLQKYGILNLI